MGKIHCIFYTFAGVSYVLASKTLDKDKVRKVAYEKGRNISGKYNKYGFWDNLVEPFIIKQFGLFFGIGHSFIKGMISDNKVKIDDQLDEIVNDIFNDNNHEK